MTGNLIIFDKNISFRALISYLFFLPQFAVIFSGLSNSPLFPAQHLWSIGVEEIFYLAIPVILLKSKHSIKVLSKLTVSYYFFASSISDTVQDFKIQITYFNSDVHIC